VVTPQISQGKCRRSLSERAASSVRVQLRRGAFGSARELYYEAHSLLRALRHYLPESGRAA
jgi:hypothetical protein